jgi:uncharacterized membrane protein
MDKIVNWIFYFYVYCFLGWCIESAIVSVEQKRFVNRGFLRCPLLPLYGSGSLVILISTTPFKEYNAFWVYFIGMVSATILEYITAVLMENILKTKYWDYSEEKWNFQGRICIKASLFWGFLSMLLVYIINPPIVRLCNYISNNVVIAIDIVVSVIFVSDTVYAFKTASDINKILKIMSNAKEELNKIHHQIQQLQQNQKEDVSEKLAELHAKKEELQLRYKNGFSKLNFFSKSMILSHPDIKSKKFNDALSEIKDKLTNK